MASSLPPPRSTKTSRSSSFKISLARASSISGSGSPFVRSRKGVVLGAVGGGTKDTETAVGEIVPSGKGVYPLNLCQRMVSRACQRDSHGAKNSAPVGVWKYQQQGLDRR